MAMTKLPLGIYVHIPFCVRKCNYCDFLSAPEDISCVREYVFMLKKEILAFKKAAGRYYVRTIYFGGGTPSSIDAGLIAEIFETIRDVFDLTFLTETTIEVNPGTVSPEKLSMYGRIGFNRLSIGVQSADDNELKMLGRIHTFEQARETVEEARKAGFMNISCDVISALPGQSMEKYKDNLEKILSLNPEHISSYSLIIEEGTKFFEMYGPDGEKKEMLPDEETDRAMYAWTKERLKKAGYERYEISNYARPGFESVHNSSYWTGTDYIGFGLGAASLIDGRRYSNVGTHGEYSMYAADETIDDTNVSTRCRLLDEVLDKEAQMSEFMILGLRMTKGVSETSFREKFNENLSDIYGKSIEKLVREGLLERSDDYIRLTDFGLDVSNIVFEEFL